MGFPLRGSFTSTFILVGLCGYKIVVFLQFLSCWLCLVQKDSLSFPSPHYSFVSVSFLGGFIQLIAPFSSGALCLDLRFSINRVSQLFPSGPLGFPSFPWRWQRARTILECWVGSSNWTRCRFKRRYSEGGQWRLVDSAGRAGVAAARREWSRPFPGLCPVERVVNQPSRMDARLLVGWP